ncbi:MAG: hypothetical protein ACI4QV_02225 [Acutalibacteraceae bacterium]
MYGLFIAAAILIMLDFRVGFTDNLMPKIIFTFSKDGLVWLDFDILPTFIGAALLFAAIFAFSKRFDSHHLSSGKKLSAALFVLSLLTFAQCSGWFIADMNRASGSSTFNPGVISDILYTVLDIVCYVLAVVALGCVSDGLRSAVGRNETTASKEILDSAQPYAFYFRTLCAIPVFIRIFLAIMNFDESVILASVTAVIYHAFCIIPLICFVRYVKIIRIALDGNKGEVK